MTTFSTHTYTAQTDTAEVLSLRAGEVSLDAGRIPHVQSELTLAVEDVALLNSLDPREGRRVTIDVTGEFEHATRTRQFDLGIRSTTPDRAAGTVTLRLASDEALLADFAQLVDDWAPRGLEGSLRDVCGYVLGKIGANLEPGTLDADVTAYWPLTNLVINPSIANATTGYSDGTGASAIDFSTAIGGFVGPSCLRWTAAGTGLARVVSAKMQVTPGAVYSASVYVRGAANSVGNTVRLGVRFYDGAGSQIQTIVNAGVTVATGVWQRTTRTGLTVPDGAATAVLFVDNMAGIAGRHTYADAFMFIESDEQVDYFDGSNTQPGYTTVWNDEVHLSTSTRTPLLERSPESTVWDAGVSGMDFLHPLLSAAGIRLVCDEQRRWTLRDADFRAPGTQTHRYGVNIESAEEQLSRDDDAWVDAAVYVYRWTVGGRERERTDAFALNDPPTKVLRVELNDTPFPGAGRAEAIVRRAQGKGRTVTITRIPTWLEHTDQELQITLDGTPIQTGIAAAIRYDFDTDTVAVTSRTVDTPAAAWTLIPVGEAWLDSPVGESWTEEIING